MQREEGEGGERAHDEEGKREVSEEDGVEEADAVAEPVGRKPTGDGECDEVAAAAASAASRAVSRVLCVF